MVSESGSESDSGSGAGDSAAGVAGASSGTSEMGDVAQPLTHRTIQMKALLITQANPQHVDLCLVQAGSQAVQFVEVTGRTNAHTVIGLVVNGHALDA